MKSTSKNGTVFRVFAGPNGHYVAEEDENGNHYQPDSGGWGWWDKRRKQEELDMVVEDEDSRQYL